MERKRGSAPTRGHVDRSINLRALQLATHVERDGSIRLAARTAKFSPSVVSRGIRGLADELGVSLFERLPFGIRTPAAGARFLQAALRMFAELAGATGAARAAGSGLVGQQRSLWEARVDRLDAFPADLNDEGRRVGA